MAGKEQLYAFCRQYDVPHNNLGKLLVATSAGQLPALSALRTMPAAGGVPLELLSKEQVAELEPEVRCEGALLSTTTGIIDSHRWGREESGLVLRTQHEKRLKLLGLAAPEKKSVIRGGQSRPYRELGHACRYLPLAA